MQARRAPLPELEYGGRQAVTAPVRRPRWLVAVAIARGVLAGFEFGAGDGLALLRRPRAQARAERPALIIGVGFFGRHALDAAFDAHLAFQRLPEEQQRGARIGQQVGALAPFVVGNAGKAALIVALN